MLFTANTPHKAYADVSGKIGIPILHIGDATGMAIQKKGFTHVGLIGVRLKCWFPALQQLGKNCSE